MPSPDVPGWYLEPDSERVERYWDAAGPTDEVRFRDPHQPNTPPPDPIRVTLDEVKNPYRNWGPRQWLVAMPFVGPLFLPDYIRGSNEALESGEIKRWSPRRRLIWRIVFAVGAVLLLISKLTHIPF